MKHTDYDFVLATPSSRLSCELIWTNDFSLNLTASGENCDRLKRIALERVER